MLIRSLKQQSTNEVYQESALCPDDPGAIHVIRSTVKERYNEHDYCHERKSDIVNWTPDISGYQDPGAAGGHETESEESNTHVEGLCTIETSHCGLSVFYLWGLWT